MKNYRINFESLYFFVIYIAMSIVCLYLFVTGKYLDFLTPKSAKYIIFMSLVMIILGLSELKEFFRNSFNSSILSSIVLIIPISLTFLPNLKINMDNISTGYNMNNLVQSKNGNSGYSKSTYQGNDMTFTIEDSKKNVNINEANSSNSFFQKKQLSGIDKENKTLTINDDEFYDWVTTIFANQDEYIGYTVTVNGKVFKSNSFMNENQFVPCRLLMTCCVADTVPAGLIANYKDTASLNSGDWVSVTGKIIMGEYNGQKGPVIDVTDIKEGHKPKYEYVYPK